MKGLTRRQFLRQALIVGTGTTLLPGLAGSAWAAERDSTVVWAQGDGAPPGRLARTAVNELGGMANFVKSGSTVVIKPNIGWDRKPEFAANTHPDLVTETARMCLEAGAAKVMIFDRTCNDPRRCYVNSGILAAVEALNDKRVEMPFIDDRRFREVDIPGGKALTKWKFYQDALEADAYINMPIAKHHAASVLTLGMKNIMGILGGNRGVIHRDIHAYLVDLNRVIRPRLVIMDATRILVANGPQGGDLADVRRPNAVIAGVDPIAVDSASCSLFGLRPNDVPCIIKGGEAGLGVADLNRISIRTIKV